MSKISQNIIGKKFGRLTVIDKLPNYYFACKCDCGKTKDVYFYSLIKGVTQSCGCLHKEITTTHGLRNTLAYRSWDHMIQRCTNPNNKFFKYYGERGIKICDRWHKFENFLADMGDRPSKHYSIERIDNNGNYEPGNCKWATKKEQQNNTRWNKLIEFNGHCLPIAEWSKITGIHREAIRSRLRKNWSIKDALTISSRPIPNRP